MSIFKLTPNKIFKLKLTGFIALILAIIIVMTQYYGLSFGKKLNASKLTNEKQTTVIFDSNYKQVTNIYGSQNRTNIKISSLPDYVKYAFVCAEDIRFYSHNGYDIKRIGGALLADIRSGQYKEGASTISQQLIKNSQLTNDKTIMRKLKEVSLSIQLERTYSKDEILEMYMNLIYFGDGAYGIEAAANTYFGKSASQLTVSEAALLAGIIKSPAKYAPHIQYDNSVKRRNIVLNIMKEQKYISQSEYDSAVKENIKILEQKDSYPHGFFTDMAIEEASKILDISVEDLISGGYKIYTTMDADLQSEVEAIAADDRYFPKCQTAKSPEGSIVVMDNKSGEIRAVVGGREHTTKLALNRATEVKRQPGSTIKPLLVYAPAMEEGLITAATPILDEKIDIAGYAPKNFSGKFSGWVSVRDALSSSLNIPAVKLFNELGVEKGKSFAENLGITFDKSDNHLALALGGMYYGTTPAELANAYQAFGNNGMFVEKHCIRLIKDNQGNTVYIAQPKFKQVVTEETAYIIDDILVSASQKAGGNLKGLPYQIACKTGTVGLENIAGFSDAWMAAFNSDYTVVSHIGYDKTDMTHYLPQSATGSTYPANMCKSIFEFLYNGKSSPTFIKPLGVVSEMVDKCALENDHTVQLATELTPASEETPEYFSKNHLPAFSDYWSIPETTKDFTVKVENGTPDIAIKSNSDHYKYLIYRQSLDGKSQKIAELSGKTGEQLKFQDGSAIAGEVYEYYFIPENTILKFGKQALRGEPSNMISVVVPY